MTTRATRMPAGGAALLLPPLVARLARARAAAILFLRLVLATRELAPLIALLHRRRALAAAHAVLTREIVRRVPPGAALLLVLPLHPSLIASGLVNHDHYSLTLP
jgi:hypothetical protein